MENQLSPLENQFAQGISPVFSWGRKGRPNIEYVIMPMPDAPCIMQHSYGFTRMSLDKFLAELPEQRRTLQGLGVAYVQNCHKSDDEADQYRLESWEIYRPDNGSHEALVMLYYTPINFLATLQKHLPDCVAQYLAELPACVRDEVLGEA